MTVTDQMLTFGSMSVDGTADKESPLHPNWFAMYAANDVTDVRPILDGAAILLCAQRENGERQRMLVEVMDALSMAFAKRHDDLVQYRIVRPNGFRDLDDFYERGPKRLGPARFDRLERASRRIKPECVLLAGGFDIMKIAHLIVQQPNSAAECFDDPGWWAIGSGAEAAINSMLFHADKLGFGISNSEEESVYHLLSAKFMAESNKLVGPQTFVVVHRFNEPLRHMIPEDIETVRKAWLRSAVPRFPQAIIAEIADMILVTDKAEERAAELRKRRRRSRSPG